MNSWVYSHFCRSLLDWRVFVRLVGIYTYGAWMRFCVSLILWSGVKRWRIVPVKNIHWQHEGRVNFFFNGGVIEEWQFLKGKTNFSSHATQAYLILFGLLLFIFLWLERNIFAASFVLCLLLEWIMLLFAIPRKGAGECKTACSASFLFPLFLNVSLCWENNRTYLNKYGWTEPRTL
jgi:hypothetical protein